MIKVYMPYFGKYFGTTDAFASLLLAWTSRYPKDLQLSMEKVASTMQHILKTTQAAANGWSSATTCWNYKLYDFLTTVSTTQFHKRLFFTK